MTDKPFSLLVEKEKESPCPIMVKLMERWWTAVANGPTERRWANRVKEHEHTCSACKAHFVAMRLEGELDRYIHDD